MIDQFTLELNSPITEEQWDTITDVDFDHTDNIWFHTKNGKDVEFVKRKKGKWNEERFKHLLTGEIRPVRVCSVCDAGWFRYDITDGVEDFTPKFCPNCGADMRGDGDE